MATFADTWQARTPKTVATLQRDFEQTIVNSALEGIARELIRTTSLLERTNRELRRKFRQVGCFSSLKGAEVAIYVTVSALSCSLVQADVVGYLSLALFRPLSSRPLTKDTLPSCWHSRTAHEKVLEYQQEKDTFIGEGD